MIHGACHCGTITFDADPQGRFLVECNCSVCRKLGAIWLHGPPAILTVHAPENSTIAYAWGDKTLTFHSCKTCGCTTHWSLAKDASRQAVNMRLAPPDACADLLLRHFDGAKTWAFLD